MLFLLICCGGGANARRGGGVVGLARLYFRFFRARRIAAQLVSVLRRHYPNVGLSERHCLPRSARACKLHGKHARADADVGVDAGSAFAQPAQLTQPVCRMSSADRTTHIPGSRRWGGGALPGAAPRRAPISDQFIRPGGLPRPPMAPVRDFTPCPAAQRGLLKQQE